MSEIREFHAALSALLYGGECERVETLVSLAEELLEAVRAELRPPGEELDLPALRVDQSLIVEWANQAAADMLNMTREEMPGTPLSRLCLSCNLDAYERCIRRAAQTGLPTTCYIKDRHGQDFLVEYRPVYGASSVTIRLHPAYARQRFDFAFTGLYRVIE